MDIRFAMGLVVDPTSSTVTRIATAVLKGVQRISSVGMCARPEHSISVAIASAVAVALASASSRSGLVNNEGQGLAMLDKQNQHWAQLAPGLAATGLGGALGIIDLETSRTIILLASIAVGAAVIAVLQQTLP
jgi:hypothetical protein